METDPTEGAAAPSPEPAAPASPGVEPVPYERFVDLVRVKGELVAERDQLRAEVQTLTEQAALVPVWQQKHADAEAKFGRFQTIAESLGTTDADAIEATEWQYGRLPNSEEAPRPEMAEWLSGIKADPTTAPAVLRPWLITSAATDGSPAPPVRRHPAAPKPTDAGGTSNVSDSQIRSVREKAVRTGDWSEWRELSKGMRKS